MCNEREGAAPASPTLSFTEALEARDAALLAFVSQRLEAAGVMLGAEGDAVMAEATDKFNATADGQLHKAAVAGAVKIERKAAKPGPR